MNVREFLLSLAKRIDQTGQVERDVIRILQGRCPECGADVSPASRDYLCSECATKEENNELFS